MSLFHVDNLFSFKKHLLHCEDQRTSAILRPWRMRHLDVTAIWSHRSMIHILGSHVHEGKKGWKQMKVANRSPSWRMPNKMKWLQKWKDEIHFNFQCDYKPSCCLIAYTYVYKFPKSLECIFNRSFNLVLNITHQPTKQPTNQPFGTIPRNQGTSLSHLLPISSHLTSNSGLLQSLGGLADFFQTHPSWETGRLKETRLLAKYNECAPYW